MRALMTAVVVMGVLIVAGVVTIVVTIVGRMGAGAAATATSSLIDEPAGTHIAGVAALSDRLALTLQGGGPDRVVVVDLRSGRIVARASLAR
jgi:hypothetical protein